MCSIRSKIVVFVALNDGEVAGSQLQEVYVVFWLDPALVSARKADGHLRARPQASSSGCPLNQVQELHISQTLKHCSTHGLSVHSGRTQGEVVNQHEGRDVRVFFCRHVWHRLQELHELADLVIEKTLLHLIMVFLGADLRKYLVENRKAHRLVWYREIAAYLMKVYQLAECLQE